MHLGIYGLIYFKFGMIIDTKELYFDTRHAHGEPGFSEMGSPPA